jgi:hypothetical protein
MIYYEGWQMTDIFIVTSNILTSVLTIGPLLYILLLIEISYSNFSLYDPRERL